MHQRATICASRCKRPGKKCLPCDLASPQKERKIVGIDLFVEITRRQIENCFTHFAAAIESLCMQITYGQCYWLLCYCLFSLSYVHVERCKIELDITQASPGNNNGQTKIIIMKTFIFFFFFPSLTLFSVYYAKRARLNSKDIWRWKSKKVSNLRKYFGWNFAKSG